MTPQHLGNADRHTEPVPREKTSRADAAERWALIDYLVAAGPPAHRRWRGQALGGAGAPQGP